MKNDLMLDKHLIMLELLKGGLFVGSACALWWLLTC